MQVGEVVNRSVMFWFHLVVGHSTVVLWVQGDSGAAMRSVCYSLRTLRVQPTVQWRRCCRTQTVSGKLSRKQPNLAGPGPRHGVEETRAPTVIGVLRVIVATLGCGWWKERGGGCQWVGTQPSQRLG